MVETEKSLSPANLKKYTDEGRLPLNVKREIIPCLVESSVGCQENEELNGVTSAMLHEAFWLSPICESIFILCSELKPKPLQLSRAEIVLKEFYTFFKNDQKITELFAEMSFIQTDVEKMNASMCSDQLINIPDIVSNVLEKTSNEKWDNLQGDKYFKRLFEAVVVLIKTNPLFGIKKVDFSVLSYFISKSCKRAKCVKFVLSPLVHYVTNLDPDDYVARRSLWQLSANCPKEYLDTFVTSILKVCSSWKNVSSILGDLVIQCEICRHILFTKLVSDRYFEDDQLICNLLGYFLGPETSRLEIFDLFLTEVCKVWADPFVVLYVPYEQLLYINKIAALGIQKHPSPAEWGKRCSHRIMEGITIYLKSSVERVRVMGSYVGQLLCNAINKGAKSKLDLPKTSTTDHFIKQIDQLVKLYETQESIAPPDSKSSTNEDNKQGTSHEKNSIDENTKVTSKQNLDSDDDDDDDDDFTPYDMSNDTPQIKFQKSAYLQDIINGLSSSPSSDSAAKHTAADLFEQTIIDAKDIILRSDQVAIDEMCLDVAKVLMHVEDKYATPEFETLRVNALGSILQRQPKKVSGFLIDMFYEANFSIRHRLDILQAIRMAAAELSELKVDTSEDSRSNLDKGGNMEQDWRATVDQRVLAKTKFFHKVKPKKKIITENKFSQVCGSFFFPFLAKYDQPIATLRLLNEDSQVFSNLLYTMGIVLHYSVNTPCAMKMAKELIGDFCQQHLNHADACVRQSVWFCALVALTAVNSAELILADESLTDGFMKYRIAAAYVRENDPHSECRLLAEQFLVNLNEVVKQVSSG